MTFVENAFKHVSKHTDRPNWINIQMRQEAQQLHLTVTNSTSDNASKDVVHYGGIGLKNVQRRLDLLYPGRYALDIQSSDTRFGICFHLNAGVQAGTPAAPALAFNYK
jgi:LytS/YehU family sensor histidine kinase